MRDHLLNPDTWLRIFLMVLFFLPLWLAHWVVGLIAALQSLSVLLTGEPNERLIEFGERMALYIREIIDYLSFASEEKPFPLSDFPSSDFSND